jgi:hypothetical protein
MSESTDEEVSIVGISGTLRKASFNTARTHVAHALDVIEKTRRTPGD